MHYVSRHRAFGKPYRLLDVGQKPRRRVLFYMEQHVVDCVDCLDARLVRGVVLVFELQMLVLELIEIGAQLFVLRANFGIVRAARHIHILIEQRQRSVKVATAVLLIYLAVYKHRLGHLLADAHYGIERGQRVLEYHGYPVAADFAKLLFGNFHQILSVVQYLAAFLNRVVGEYAEYGARRHRFARTAFAHDCERFARVQIEIYIAHRLHLPAVGAERYFQILYG